MNNILKTIKKNIGLILLASIGILGIFTGVSSAAVTQYWQGGTGTSTAPVTGQFLGGYVSSSLLCNSSTTPCYGPWTFSAGTNITISTATPGILSISAGSGGSVSTSSPITSYNFPYWANTNGGLSGTSTIFYVSSTANIGIGTTNPSQKLEVVGNVSSTGLIVNGNTTTTSLTIGTLNGILKGTSGVVGTATNGTDYTLITALTCGANQHLVSTLANGTFTCSLDNPSSTIPIIFVSTLNNLSGAVIATGTANQINVSTSSGQVVFSISSNYTPSSTIPSLPISIANGGTATGTAPADNQFLVGDSGIYKLKTLTAGSNITITTSTTAVTIASTGGSGTPAGSSTYVQYNDSNTFAATSTFTFSSSTQRLTLGSPSSSLFIGTNANFATSSVGCMSITGGTTSTSGGRIIHTFTASGTLTLTGCGSFSFVADLFMIGGGGGGGSGAGGGGGAGGAISASTTLAGGNLSVVVGNGGNGGTSNGAGNPGSTSTFNGLSAAAGGYGSGNGASNLNGGNGGSGGGGSGDSVATTQGGTATPAGQGKNGAGNGGFTASPFPAGGAGGANATGSVPSNGSTGGNGGNGTSTSIDGSNKTYGGGGGGGIWNAGVGGLGGTGNAGAGATGAGNPGQNASSSSGSGGGGGAQGQNGGNGGSGIVVISYPSSIIGGTTAFSTSSAALYVGGHIFTGNQNLATSSVSSCGTAPNIEGNDTNGKVTVGSGVVTACTVNFGQPFTNIPNCVVSPWSTTVSAGINSEATSSFTVGFSATLGGGKFNYICLDSAE